MSEPLDAVFAALADPTRRAVLETLLRDGSTSVPALTGALPMSRQAIAKHLAVLGDAGLVERASAGSSAREVRYRLRDGALEPAATWIARADAAWDGRLARLKETVERGR